MDRYFIRYLIMFMTYCAAFRMGAQIERYVIKHGPIISMPVMDEPPYDEDTFITVWPVDPVTSEGPPPVTEPTILRNQLMCPPVRPGTVLVMQEISYLTVRQNNHYHKKMLRVPMHPGSVLTPTKWWNHINHIIGIDWKGRTGWIPERDKKGNILLCYPPVDHEV